MYVLCPIVLFLILEYGYISSEWKLNVLVSFKLQKYKNTKKNVRDKFDYINYNFLGSSVI